METTLIRAACLYLPVTAIVIAAILRPAHRRLFAATLVGFFWNLPTLLALQLLNLRFGWWSFHAEGALLRGMPVDLLLGWALLWGVLPVLLFRRLRIRYAVAIFALTDLTVMPLCAPLVELHRSWLGGEAVALVMVLVPTLYFSRWTYQGTYLYRRAVMQVITVVGLCLLLFPEIVMALRGGDFSSVLTAPAWIRSLEIQLLFLFALPALSAVHEFVTRGSGTPIPYDPPQFLVTSGLYRYVANPMQLAAALTVAAWGVMLRSPWIAAFFVGTVFYSIGVAAWDEQDDLELRFGSAFQRFRREVRDWFPRWRPYVDPQATRSRIYIAESCGMCSEVRHWIERRDPVGLEIIAAEDHPTHALTRMTYIPMDGSAHEQGIRAFARTLEHLNLAWALAGAFLRLPLVADLLQLLADASGMGPRNANRNNCQLPPRAA